MIFKSTQRKTYASFANIFLLFLFLISLSVQSQNWETVTSLSGIDADETHRNLFFLNANTGWIARNDGAILKTIDGGTTWSVQATNTRVADIFFISETKGWAAGDLNVYYTTNGGDTWTKVQAGSTIGSESIYSVYFISETHGWASGLNYIYRTTDGGLTWLKVLPSGFSFNDIYFTSETVGYAVGSGNKILKTIDAGVTWVEQNAGTLYTTHNAIHFTDANTAFVCGKYGIIKKSIDAGATWTSIISQDYGSPSLNDIFFIDANNGWVVGNERTIKHTSDGGLTWTDENTLQSDQYKSFRSVFFTGATTGFALAYDDLQTYSIALAPIISGFSPTTATYGDTMVITGEHFNGTKNITLGGVDVQSFTVDSPTQITLTVGPGLSGNLAVTNFGGTITSGGFNYINQSPNMVDIDDVSYCQSFTSYSVPISVSDIESLPANLTVTATSNNETIVTNANILVTGSTETKVLNITPETGTSGIVTITVTVEDEENDTAQKTFELTVGGDISKPVALTQNISVSLDVTGNASITPEDIDFGSSDNCSSSAGSTPPIYLSGGQTNKLWSFIPGIDITPQEIAVDWSVVGDYGGSNYFGNYGALEINELTNELFVAGGSYDKNYVMKAPINGNSPMNHYTGQFSYGTTIDFEIENTTQTVYTATTDGIFSEAIGSGNPTLLIAGDIKGITLDTTNNTLYFVTTAGISKVQTDGTSLSENFLTVDNPALITMDTVTGRLFWIEKDLNAVYTALADGTETPYALYTNTSITGIPYAIDFAPKSNEIYYSITGGSYYNLQDYILKAPADGTGVPETVISGDLGGTTGIATGKNYTPRPDLQLSLDITTFTCSDVGENRTVTLTVKDDSDNESTKTALVTVTDTNNYCGTLSLSQHENDNKFVLYPNPTDHVLHIKNNLNTEINSINIYDLNGRMVINESVNKSQESVQINTTNLQASIYIIKIKTSTSVVVKRFTKQ
ncbi:YCF48-related protein [Algibacter sp. L4_22]|uniref:YCF48-related protein n=1 Tax=Algibacter sp. L4_22 TaxID=2942477 RepID=UPI00201B507C|nr:YCF48-related protein [Algibacter sp. L4_22]MCL5128934.1 YCF48-related protein [Algibacter sp. L4_22]